MAIDNVGLAAQALYNKIQSQPKVTDGPSPDVYNQNVKFQDVFNVQLNRFASMTSEQILQHIQDYKNPASIGGGVIETAISSVKKSLRKQEKVARKALINEASLIDVLTATTEASNTMKMVTEVRNKFMEAFDRVMNMSV